MLLQIAILWSFCHIAIAISVGGLVIHSCFYNPWNATTYALLSQQVNDGGCLAGIISICTYDTCMSMCCFSQRPGNLLPTPGVVDIVQ